MKEPSQKNGKSNKGFQAFTKFFEISSHFAYSFDKVTFAGKHPED